MMPHRSRSRQGLILAAWLTGQTACSKPPSGAARPAHAGDREAPRVQSNILRSDYVGSAECQVCHAEIFQGWKDSPMRNMTRHAGRARIQAPFEGAVFRLKNDSVTMQTHDGQKFMRLASQDGGGRLYRITRVIGGRYREDFAGIDVTGAAEPASDPGRGDEMVLPVSFVLSTRSWRYKGYSVMIPERPSLRAGPVWTRTCIGCHNTLPYASLLYDDLYGPGGHYQGSVSDHLLPQSRTWNLVLTNEHALKRAIADEMVFLGSERPNVDQTGLRDFLADAMQVTRQRLQGSHLVELGVGCEACHGGAREHLENSRLPPSFETRSPFLETTPPPGPTAPTRAQWINRTCARCHTVLFSRYPWTWEGGRRSDQTPGGSSTNSGEARDFLLGGCATQMSCTACHDPHTRDHSKRLQQLEGPAGRALCTSCHEGLGSDAAVSAHTHHRPDGAGSSCIGCHMPKKNTGLGYSLTRYHRIGSPTDRARVLGDRPLECALCHLDSSVETLVLAMERWWGKRYDRPALRALYGDDLHMNVLKSTLSRGKAHEQTVAIALLGESRRSSAVPLLVPELSHEFPLVRYFAKHALQTLTQRRLPVDVNQSASSVATQAQDWLTRTLKDAAPVDP